MTTQTKTTWREVKLGEVAGVLGGFAFKSGWFNSQKIGYPTVKIQNIKDGLVDVTNAEYVDIGKIKRDINKFKLGKGDLLVAMTGATAGKVGILTQDKICYLNQRVGKFYSKDDSVLDKKFLHYSVLNPGNLNMLKKLADGSAQGNMSSSQIEDTLEVSFPENPADQKRIAAILSAFDDKIELNNKINQTLEKTAQAIFKEWFMKNEKLKGWETKNIMEIVKRLPVDKRYSNKTALPTGKVPILDQGRSGIIGFHNEEASIKASIEEPVAVFANHTCYYRLVTFDFSCIQNVIPYVGVHGYPTIFVYFLTKDKIKMSDYKGHWPEFEAQKFIVPPPNLAVKFNQKIQPLIGTISKNEEENIKLASLRDFLLPKLMSGEVRVNYE